MKWGGVSSRSGHRPQPATDGDGIVGTDVGTEPPNSENPWPVRRPRRHTEGCGRHKHRRGASTSSACRRPPDLAGGSSCFGAHHRRRLGRRVPGRARCRPRRRSAPRRSPAGCRLTRPDLRRDDRHRRSTLPCACCGGTGPRHFPTWTTSPCRPAVTGASCSAFTHPATASCAGARDATSC